MEDLNITSITSNGKKLFNAPDESSSVNIHEVYSRGWIKKQRLALKRRLGVETSRQQRGDVAIATKFVSTKELLARSDVMDKGAAAFSMVAVDNNDDDGDDGDRGERQDGGVEGEGENWFVRIFRFMVIG